MQTFISETVTTILQTTKSFRDVVFVLPSQRANIFVKQAFKDKISTGFLPEILNIEELIALISELKKTDATELLFYFYGIYKELADNPDSFEVFSSWAYTAIQDFNEIDQNLISPKDIFVYLRDIHRLRKWSVKGEFKETQLIKDHFSFIEKLHHFYEAFYLFLVKNKIGYQGILYREATEKVATFINNNKHKKYIFIGFNALNKAEEFLFQQFLLEKNTEIYWDIDVAFLESNHEAGSFLRKYKTQWKYYQKNPIKIVKNHFSEKKNITLIGAPKNNTQIKHVGEILKTFTNYNNTALVLADEALLPITLNSLPQNVNAVNITMGYPLKDIPTTSLMFAFFQLFINQKKLQKNTLFYYKDVIGFIKNSSIYQLFQMNTEINIADVILNTITKENNTFISQQKIVEILSPLNQDIKKVIQSIFNPFTSIDDFLQRIIELINVLKEKANPLEKEYLFRFYTVFTQLQNLDSQFNYIQDLKTLYLFFRQLIISENLSFQGEPLQGLQIMGMLETRLLDFENVIITSVNEGVLPANKQRNSFIPFDVKIAFELPTYKEKDALFSYHFFRLLQRAKNIYILYNTENDAFGSGEKSRFLAQLAMMRNDVVEKIISPKVIAAPIELKIIKKDSKVIKRLEEIAKKGISPSALTSYLYNPIAFYKQKILKINELEDVEETIAANTMGTVIHDTLDELYQPYIGKFLAVNDIEQMLNKTKELVSFYFLKHFKSGDITTGKNRLIFEVANRFIINFLSKEKKILQNENNELKIIATEQELTSEIKIEGIPFPIKLKGIVDRIDELNGVTRIIDYKTGMVEATNLKVTDFKTIREIKYHKAIQVLLYVYLYTKQKEICLDEPITAGIFSFKNLKSGFLAINFSANYRSPDYKITQEHLDEFIVEIKKMILEIYNPEVDFVEPKELPY
ncbi:PD-(D/E)XK nuclease family protein [Tenacibaculum sp. UWU-22]|uniref:PD-(D/E)XK nuclease family protein n=1 Tax=Tenacibaculum sp. UWU-22 TaxID=3234187 RepID=UPI0034DADB15